MVVDINERPNEGGEVIFLTKKWVSITADEFNVCL